MKNMTHIIWYDTIDSTNNEAKRLLPELASGTVLAARQQTAGRGQRGNSWSSKPGNNLTFSLVLKFGEGNIPDVRPDCQFVISEAVALGVKEFLSEEGVVASIKWPNDIYVGDRKICGILIENTVKEGRLTSSIAGIGLNMNQDTFPPDIPNPTSLALQTGRTYDMEKSLVRLLAHLMDKIGKMETAPGELKESYLEALYRKGEKHKYIDFISGEEFEGTIKGISDSALLQVESEDGSVRGFSFKEIGYII